MKIVVFILGCIVSMIFCFIVFSLVSHYQVSKLNYTPNQSDRLTDWFIVITPLTSIIGGWLSLVIYKKYLTGR